MAKKATTFFASEVERLYLDNPLSPEKYQQVRQAKHFMDTHYGESIELSHLADAAYMSRYHFIRVFQKMYGLTPRVYLRDLRMTKAKSLLKQGMPITQVCFSVGYESTTTFSSIFKKCIGLSPKSYQKQHKSNLE